MTYDLSARKSGDVLDVRVTGTRNREAVLAVVLQVLEQCSKEGTRKVLLDLHQFEGQLPFIDNYDLPDREFPAMWSVSEVKTSAVAIVDSPETADRFALMADVAKSRGFNVRVFGDIKRAREWLGRNGA